jgi:hypothetical protein
MSTRNQSTPIIHHHHYNDEDIIKCDTSECYTDIESQHVQNERFWTKSYKFIINFWYLI